MWRTVVEPLGEHAGGERTLLGAREVQVPPFCVRARRAAAAVAADEAASVRTAVTARRQTRQRARCIARRAREGARRERRAVRGAPAPAPPRRRRAHGARGARAGGGVAGTPCRAYSSELPVPGPDSSSGTSMPRRRAGPAMWAGRATSALAPPCAAHWRLSRASPERLTPPRAAGGGLTSGGGARPGQASAQSKVRRGVSRACRGTHCS